MRRSLLSVAAFSFIVFVGCSFYHPASASSTTATTQLPHTVRPIHYAISLIPDAAESRFTSTVAIRIEVVQPTSSITLNAEKLTFQNVTLADSRHPKVIKIATKINVNPEKQTATFQFAQQIARGTYILSIDYAGVIGKQANGLFSIDYDATAGDTAAGVTATRSKRALYTQFESADARRFVPCWDEPAYKATFALSATVPANEMAVSNMPVMDKKSLPDGRNIIYFAPTPVMSTYLLFFGLGDFERTADVVDGTEIGVITRRGVLAQAAFPLEAAKAILPQYNDYFGVRYPLPKLDNVAAPGRSQFFSAMENWGAIFTFEHGMLQDPAISTQRDKERAFVIVAHEMAHQWFGDLVTMRWWDDLWLNEGFASWMESRITERLHPEWSTSLATVGVHDSAMELDSLLTSHAIVQPIETVAQASEAFDQITYQKGESVIHMLENYAGADTWRDGVRLYMKNHAYGNTTSDDFWQAIEKASAKPITQIAHDFTLQPGVPLIKVGDTVCENGNTTVSLIQSEFSRDNPNKKARSWRVPVTAEVLGSASEPAHTLVTEGKAQVRLAGCGPVLINVGQTGYFRTLYSSSQFNALTTQFARIAPIDQLGILSDSWALGLAGLQPVSDFLNLANVVPLDADPSIWMKIARVYNSIYLSYASGAEKESKEQREFGRYAITRLKPVMDKMSWNKQSDDTTAAVNLREQLIDVLGQLGDEATIAEARRRYVRSITAKEADSSAEFPVELRKVIMKVVALNADTETWNKLRALAKTEKSAMMKDQLYLLISSSKDPALARRALAVAITDEPSATTSAGMVAEVARLHPDLAFDFAIAHLAQVDQFVDAGSKSRYLPRIASSSVMPGMIEKLKSYANTHLASSSQVSTNIAIANIHFQIKIRSQRLPVITTWLDGIDKS